MKILNNKVTESGNTNTIECPQCGEPVSMPIIRSSASLGPLGIPVYKYKVEYFAICPKCNSLYAVQPDKRETVIKTTADDISNIGRDSLTFIKKLC